MSISTEQKLAARAKPFVSPMSEFPASASSPKRRTPSRLWIPSKHYVSSNKSVLESRELLVICITRQCVGGRRIAALSHLDCDYRYKYVDGVDVSRFYGMGFR
jgi:hypothetical protein